MNQVHKNYIYQVLYQLLNMLLPLATAPYISRILGPEGIGEYAYVYSVSNYFLMILMLGIPNYGSSKIAKSTTPQKFVTTFHQIYFIQFINACCILSCYIFYSLHLSEGNKVLSLIQTLYVLSGLFDITWLFYGMEEFKKVSVRNSIIRIFNVITIFLFIKTRQDLWLYVFIMAASTLLTQISIWPFIPKIIFRSKIVLGFQELKIHLRGILLLFLPVIAISIYKVMDKIMLGNFSSMAELGYYENSEKVINLPLGLITALGTVMLPKMSSLIANNKHAESLKLIGYSLSFVMFLSFPLAFGIAAVGVDFAPLFWGADFEKCGFLLIGLAPTIIFISWANVLRTQFIIPQGLNWIYIVTVFGGALINCIFNFIFIPRWDAFGAVAGTIAAEAAVCVGQSYLIRRRISMISNLLEIPKYFITSAVMFFAVKLCSKLFEEISLIAITCEILTGAVVYLGIMFIWTRSTTPPIFLSSFIRKKNVVS